MDFIRSKWRTITLVAIVLCYILFVFVMDQRTDLFVPAILVYLVVTAILFLSTIVGLPGIIVHSFFKNEKAAIPFYKAAINLGTTNVNILAAYGLILLNDYQPAEAKELFEKALKHSKHYMYNKTIQVNISLCEWKMNNLDGAVKIYEELYYFPDLEPIEDFSLENLEEGVNKNHNFTAQDFTTMGFIMHLHGDEEKAEYFSKTSLEKLDSYGPAFDNLGQIEYKRGNLDLAKEHFEKALELKPGMSDSEYYLAKINKEQDNIEESKKYLNQIEYSRINGLSTITKEEVDALKKEVGL